MLASKMRIVSAEIFHIQLPMKFPFVTGFGAISKRDAVILKLTDKNGLVGWGEGAALWGPVYLEESAMTNVHIIKDFLVPILRDVEISHEEYMSKSAFIRGNNLAKFAVDAAIWSIDSQTSRMPIHKLIGGVRKQIPVGESIGMVESTPKLLEIVEKRISEGYQRIKLKIKPGCDYEYVSTVRKAFPKLKIMVDGNSSYSLDQADLLRKLDDLDLMMIEQPLAYDDIIDHATLQKQLKTPICLDESILSAEDARKACEIGACKIINVKPGRVGSLDECKKINEVAKKFKIQLWLGGMLETGIGKSYNLMAASLSEFTLPADISPSKTFFDEGITNPDVQVTSKGFIEVPTEVGLGFKVLEDKIEKYQIGNYKIF